MILPVYAIVGTPRVTALVPVPDRPEKALAPVMFNVEVAPNENVEVVPRSFVELILPMFSVAPENVNEALKISLAGFVDVSAKFPLKVKVGTDTVNASV